MDFSTILTNAFFNAIIFTAIVGMGVFLVSKFVKSRRVLQALPFTASKSLKERMKGVGLTFSNYPSMDFIPTSIRGDFFASSSAERFGAPSCHHCHKDVASCLGQILAIHDGNLGWFCVSCGAGTVLPIVIKNRQAVGLPPIPSKNLYQILNVLERDAVAKGLLKPSNEVTEEEAPPVTFETVLDATTGYRDKPMRVRVDIRNQTVVPVDAIPEDEGEEPGVVEEQPRQKIRLVHSKE
ncbi:hypothetical protein KBC54_00030 [Patescibacteria group bacterium]|nr:hypothetical protein [Patescibacteria group bacterium]